MEEKWQGADPHRRSDGGTSIRLITWNAPNALLYFSWLSSSSHSSYGIVRLLFGSMRYRRHTYLLTFTLCNSIIGSWDPCLICLVVYQGHSSNTQWWSLIGNDCEITLNCLLLIGFGEYQTRISQNRCFVISFRSTQKEIQGKFLLTIMLLRAYDQFLWYVNGNSCSKRSPMSVLYSSFW